MRPNETYRAFRDTKFFGSLDGLRCFCIAFVLWHHRPENLTGDDPIMILTRGFTGVDFFFVLSGFLITTLLLREEERNGRFSLLSFFNSAFFANYSSENVLCYNDVSYL